MDADDKRRGNLSRFDSDAARIAAAKRWERKPFTDALIKALSLPGPRGLKQLDLIARQLVNAAVNGDMQAVKLVMERIEGKADQRRITEHEHSISQQMLSALREASRVPKAQVIDGKVTAVELVEVKDNSERNVKDGPLSDDLPHTQAPDLSPARPLRRNSGDLISAARRAARK